MRAEFRALSEAYPGAALYFWECAKAMGKFEDLPANLPATWEKAWAEAREKGTLTKEEAHQVRAR